MTWTRNHSAGKDSSHYKEWRGGRGKYRITWRDQVEGVTVPPGYHACMQGEGARDGCGTPWVFVTGFSGPRSRHLLRTLQAAKHACERHADPTYRLPRKKKKK